MDIHQRIAKLYNIMNSCVIFKERRLSKMVVLKDGKIVDTVPVTDPREMWVMMKNQAVFKKYGHDVHVRFIDSFGFIYKEFILKTRRNGRTFVSDVSALIYRPKH